MSDDIIIDAVRRGIERYNRCAPTAERVGSELSTPLLGERSVLDSLAFVRLVIAVELAVNEGLHCAVTLADEKAFAKKNSPFANVQSLVEYIRILTGVRYDG